MTVENSVIIPLFAMILVALISFNLVLHDRIVDRTKELRRDYIEAFENEQKQPEEVLRKLWALDKVVNIK